MEDRLDDIASGKREYVKTLKDFYTPFLKEIKAKERSSQKPQTWATRRKTCSVLNAEAR